LLTVARPGIRLSPVSILGTPDHLGVDSLDIETEDNQIAIATVTAPSKSLRLALQRRKPGETPVGARSYEKKISATPW
jgi:hypothetical protein